LIRNQLKINDLLEARVGIGPKFALPVVEVPYFIGLLKRN